VSFTKDFSQVSHAFCGDYIEKALVFCAAALKALPLL
jgi:hypothetical protein